jgi:raffinose/stachyose/melibiose transport system permease protein
MEGKKISCVILWIVIIVLALYTLFPIIFLMINSFKDNQSIIASPLALPMSLDFSYIANAAQQIHFFKALLITSGVTVVSVGLILLVSALAAWIMVRNKSKVSTIMLLAFTAAMLIPFQAIMYPLISLFDSANLKNLIGLVIMYGGFGLSLSIFLYHGFIKSVPRSIEEAAVIDGASIPQMFFMVVFPLLKTTTVTVIILNAMWIWNDYLLPYMVIGDNAEKTLTLELYFAKMTSGAYGNPWQLIFPAVLVSIVPIIIIFLFLQKYFVKGVADGAVKA